MAYWLSAVFDSSFSFPYRWNHDTVEKERKWGKEGTGKRCKRRKTVWGGETVILYLDTLAPSPWVMLLFSIFIITSFPLKNHPPTLLTIDKLVIFDRILIFLSSTPLKPLANPLCPIYEHPVPHLQLSFPRLFISRRSNDATAGRDHPVWYQAN